MFSWFLSSITSDIIKNLINFIFFDFIQSSGIYYNRFLAIRVMEFFFFFRTFLRVPNAFFANVGYFV